jgi:hypothetical protein
MGAEWTARLNTGRGEPKSSVGDQLDIIEPFIFVRGKRNLFDNLFSFQLAAKTLFSIISTLKVRC